MQYLSIFKSLTKNQSWLKYGTAILAGSLFLTLSSKIDIPFWPVPITMQSFAVIFLSALYGRNLAIATVTTYILEGALGIPVFQGMKVGAAALLSPTGGYILGFSLTAFVIGSLADRGWGKTHLSAAGLFILGAIVIDIPGIAWLLSFVGTEQVVQIWLSYQIAFILKKGLGTIVIPMIKNRKISNF